MHNADPKPSIWVHAAGSEHHRAALYLCERIWGITGHVCSLSSNDAWPGVAISRNSAWVYHSDINDAPSLWHSLPDTNADLSVIWVGSPKFNGIARLSDRDRLNIILSNITLSDIPQKRLGLFESHSLRVICDASLICVETPETADRIARASVPMDRIKVTGALQRAVSVPAILGDSHEFDMIKQRPRWGALNVSAPELGSVLAAHRIVLRSNHRMLLILAPQTEDLENDFAAQIEHMGLRVARRSLDQYPDNSTAVYLADGPDEYARWISWSGAIFLANSLYPQCRGLDPYPAAALGAAILYGPYISNHLEDYSQLTKAGAARIIGDSDSLATAVLQTSNPALAAQMGVAAWDYISAGAEATDCVISAVIAHHEG